MGLKDRASASKMCLPRKDGQALVTEKQKVVTQSQGNDSNLKDKLLILARPPTGLTNFSLFKFLKW